MRYEHEEILNMLRAHGFAAGFFLPLFDLRETWAKQCRAPVPHAQGLCVNPLAEFSETAQTLLLLVKAYAPIKGIPGYYIASNAGYHAANALESDMLAKGRFAKRIEPPYAALIEKAGIGGLLKNGLLLLPGFGTRTALFAIVTDACTPLSYPDAKLGSCARCMACARACPAQAIDAAHGLCAQKCLRNHMESAPMPELVMQKLPGLLGCEICQDVCPRNAGIAALEPTNEQAYAFSKRRLVRGDIKEARALVGKNMTGRGRLRAQAAVLLANEGDVSALDDIETLLLHPEEAVRAAASYAKRTLGEHF